MKLHAETHRSACWSKFGLPLGNAELLQLDTIFNGGFRTYFFILLFVDCYDTYVWGIRDSDTKKAWLFVGCVVGTSGVVL